MIFKKNQSIEKRYFIHSLLFPSFFSALMILFKLFENLESVRFTFLGVYPRDVYSLGGIIFSPLIHGDWGHLFSNLPSFIILTVSLFYFYRGVSYRAFFSIYFLSGIVLWLIGREGWHVGASGVIYGLGAFLFFSGVMRNYIPLIAIALIITFLYGSMVWGIFPFSVDLPYSWEGHLAGSVVGIIISIILRHKGPQRKVKIWEEEDDDEENPYWKISNTE